MKKAKRLFAISMAALMAAASLAACGNSSSETQAPAGDSTGGGCSRHRHCGKRLTDNRSTDIG